MIRKQKRVSKTSLLLLLIVKDLNKAIFHLVIREEAVSSGNGKVVVFFFFLSHQIACRISVSQPGIKPGP